MSFDLEEYEGKRVELKLNGEEEQLLGTVQSGAPEMIAFKEKGKAGLELVRKDEIEYIRLAAEAEPELRARRLNIVGLDTVKRHLVDRHGYALADINEMSSEEAFSFHENLDHEPLSHYHADPPSKRDENTPQFSNADED